MHRILMAGILSLTLLGCASLRPTASNAKPQPAIAPTPPITPAAVAPTQNAVAVVEPPTAATPTAKVAPPSATSSPPLATPVKRAPPPKQAYVASVPEKAPTAPAVNSPSQKATAPTLDLASLEQRLRDTHAIGVFTKLSLKNQVDDLLDQFRGIHRGQPNPPLTELRQRYDLLMMKVLTLLQDNDSALASAILSSREAIWDILKDPKKFAQI